MKTRGKSIIIDTYFKYHLNYRIIFMTTGIGNTISRATIFFYVDKIVLNLHF